MTLIIAHGSGAKRDKWSRNDQCSGRLGVCTTADTIVLPGVKSRVPCLWGFFAHFGEGLSQRGKLVNDNERD